MRWLVAFLLAAGTAHAQNTQHGMFDTQSSVSGFAGFAPLNSPAFQTRITSPFAWLGGATPWFDSIPTMTGFTAAAIANGGLMAQSGVGSAVIWGAHRSSDSTLVGAMSFTEGLFPWNNNATQVQTAYGLYVEPHREAGAGTTQGIEIGMVNAGSTVAQNPFNMASTGVTPAYWASAGKSGATSNPASSAFGIIANGTTFDAGILFDANALTLHGGVGYAMGMGTNQALTWWNSSQVINAQIVSTSSAIGAAAITFNDGGIAFTARDQSVPIQLTNGSVHMDGVLTYTPVAAFMTGANASLILGAPAASNTPFLAFHSSGNSGVTDAQIMAGGGSSTANQGVLYYNASAHAFSGSVVMNNPLSTSYGGTGANTAALGAVALNTGMVTLTAGTTVATDASQARSFKLTAAQSFTLSNPTNLATGGWYTWEIVQDATGSRVATWGALFKFSGGSKTLSTTASSIDVVKCFYDGAALLCELNKAYS